MDGIAALTSGTTGAGTWASPADVLQAVGALALLLLPLLVWVWRSWRQAEADHLLALARIETERARALAIARGVERDAVRREAEAVDDGTGPRTAAHEAASAKRAVAEAAATAHVDLTELVREAERLEGTAR